MLPYVLFTILVLFLLALDLGIASRRPEITFREALIRTGIWVGLAMAFNLFVWWIYGHRPAMPGEDLAATTWWKRGAPAALEFLTGYIVEEALSIDNIFVFVVIFRYFQVPKAHQHKVLFWGIIGALVFRAIFIATGIALIRHFEWTLYIFGGLLLLTGLKLMRGSDEQLDIDNNRILKTIRRLIPVTPDYVGSNFLARINGRTLATPLLVVLIFVECTDILFAVDSVPAIIAITHDPFIVYTSNVFAILGLRSLYFALAGVMGMFRFLSKGLAFILIFIGIKMLLQVQFHLKIPILISLGVIASTLTLSVVVSILFPEKETETVDALDEETAEAGEA